MANENTKMQYWAAKDGEVTLFDLDDDEDVKEYVLEMYGKDCEWGGLTSLKDLRFGEKDDVIEWFDAHCFDKEESWNYVLDVAEKHFKCEFQDGARKKISDWLFSRFKEHQEEESEEEEESDEPKIVEKDECDDCEGKCRADETKNL